MEKTTPKLRIMKLDKFEILPEQITNIREKIEHQPLCTSMGRAETQGKMEDREMNVGFLKKTT